MNAQDYAVNAGDVFVLPEAVLKIKQLIDDDATSMRDIADVINYDPAVMSQVLKISNSALYQFPNTITTVTKAIQVIGTGSIYDLVLSYGVANAFKDIDPDVVDLEKFWELSVSCALLCKFLAEEVGLKEPEKLFVCGLLHNLGELVLVQLNPEDAHKCASISSENTPLLMQKKYLGFSYSDISFELLKLWGIPQDISKLVSRTHASEYTAQNKAEKIIQLAYLLALNNVHSELYSIHSGITENMYQSIGIDEECVNNALDFSNLKLMSVLALFSPSTFTIF
ncbi:HDOD domain-containing protein [Paraglaciecola sp. MB-3u-78]|jgi:HD-like signal output (HDOD) protein|uniref:HDOD domain-containing protein n=1 Tax=Paraglaciecola sp. MB-3u-78 TaxID=2058332 RepID=UPI000C34513F|nr:HDOD domain-containing protein [Paraglaciecola sp. MB-3u-78]PKG96022.1 histidine kinase [Paraglaciecola sp. MB-3u-78]